MQWQNASLLSNNELIHVNLAIVVHIHFCEGAGYLCLRACSRPWSRCYACWRLHGKHGGEPVLWSHRHMKAGT
jgi:hypothetical protein